ncbi:hypothetical protein PLESTB_000543900 [Pleodorina starrii]|uniref:RING-type domain-containing protein n=1 Tax=Pleodorina starrii TaxID=330485 RepID=A0A9W6F0W8_9CHLO|nr:hypothetical protein PLESTB_000543900 [Pleodorina starrii]GLC77091.1 hypothetical protein PLESTF_001883300 [Pleodorina starrii]
MSSDPGTSPVPPGASAPRKRLPGCCMYWRSPFFIAVEEGDAEEVVRFLRQDHKWLKQTDTMDRRTAWHTAAANGHVEVLRALVDRTREDDVGLTWVSQATLSSRLRGAAAARRDPVGPEQRVSELVNGRSSLGISPLILAAERDQADAVKYLLSVGADPWLGDHEGRNPVHYAAKSGSIRALQVLLEEEKPLTSRASNRNHSGTRFVDSVDMFGFTPLHYATWANRKSAMMVLIGFDANIITRSAVLHTDLYSLPAGSTPLHIACLLGDLDRVKMLLRAYYETAADLLPSQTALLGSVERRRRARSHPDPRLILTRTQRLPFHIAARAGHRELLDWLDPSVPLMFLFGGEDAEGGAAGAGGQGGGMAALVGVSRLTVIAARALHQALLASLDAAAADIARHAEEQAARRRRREERRMAREAEAAAQSLKQGKEPPPDGIRSRIRRLIERASKDGGGGAATAAAAAPGGPAGGGSGRVEEVGEAGGGSEAPKVGWRPWRGRGARRGRRKVTSSGTADPTAAAAGAGADGGQQQQQHSATSRSPRRRRRRSAMGVAGRGATVGGGGGAAAAVAQVVTTRAAAAAPGGCAGAAAPEDGDVSSSSSDDDDDVGAEGSRGGLSPKQPEAQQAPPPPPPPQPPPPQRASGSGALNGSLRLRIFRSSASQLNQQLQPPQHRSSNAGGRLEGPPAAAAGADAAAASGGGAADGGGSAAASPVGGPSSGGGGLAASLTRTMLQRLYRGSLRRQGSGSADSDPAQAQLNERLNRAGITIPEGPDEEAAYFTPGREPRYNMPTRILLPASAFNTSIIRTAEIGSSPTAGLASLGATDAVAATNTTDPGPSPREEAPGPAAGAAPDDSAAVEGPRGCRGMSGGGGCGAAGGCSRCPSAAGTEETELRGPAGTSAGMVTVADEAVGGTAGSDQADGEAATAAAAAAGPAAGVAKAPSEPHPPLAVAVAAADLTSVEQLLSEEDRDAAVAAPLAAEPAGALGIAPPSPPRPGSAAAPLRPRPPPPPPLTDPPGESEQEDLPLVASSHRGADSEGGARPDLDLEPDRNRNRNAEPHRGGQSDLSSPSCCSEAAAGAGAIRSAGASRVPSRRPSLQLPGAAGGTSDSGLPSPASLLPPPALPPVRQLSGDVGAGAASSTSRTRLSEEGGPQPLLPLLLPECSARAERGAASADGAAAAAAAAAPAAAEGGDRAATMADAEGGGWALASGMGRVGAGAMQLLSSLRGTLRRSSGRHPAQVVPVTCGPSSPSPNRRYHHHHHRRSRTPDSSQRRGFSPGRSPVHAAAAVGAAASGPLVSPARGSPGGVTQSPGSGAGAEGAERDAVSEQLRSPNPSSPQRSAVGPHHHHHHNHLAARGVRVSSGKTHARVSLYGRLSAAFGAAEGAPSGVAAAVARRRAAAAASPPPRSDLTSVSQAESSAAQCGTERGGSVSEPQDGAQATAAAAAATEEEPPGGAAARGGDCGAAESLRVGGAAASSFSSTSSRGGTGGAAGAAGNDEEDVCPVCLDEAPNLLVQTCRHQICMDCARDLVRRHSLTPALCPYCRGIISSFKARVAAGRPPPRR